MRSTFPVGASRWTGRVPITCVMVLRLATRAVVRRSAGAVVAAAVALVLVAPSSPAVAALTSAPASAATVGSAAMSPGAESDFVARVNSLRASKGLRQLQVSGDVVGVARRWTDRMVQDGQISHNPSLGSQVPGAWTKLGENVGVGYDVGGLMNAFLDSPSHHRNLVDPDWTHIGVGVRITGDGRMWTTHNFMALESTAAPPPPPPPPSQPTQSSPPTTAAQLAPGTTTITTAPPAPPGPQPSAERVTAVLDPLRSLEAS